jgi:FMN phosphatase YigB (HAD superfamily)
LSLNTPPPAIWYRQDIGFEKPDPVIFSRSFEQARFWLPDLQKHEVLHIGDSLAADYCGARAAGMQVRDC